mmetsp:Transcript_37046/g.56801  ORF Transcript_37046/g.56801 Transcript_37046/m.56801 type:complete len:312 (+) Transcript_37046:173-1108(+)
MRQLQGRLLLDLVAVFPFPSMFEGLLSPATAQLLYFLKIVRLYHGFQLLDYHRYKTQLKEAQVRRIQKKIALGTMVEDPLKDMTHVTPIMFLTQVLRILRLIIILLCLSYFTGVVWFLACERLRNPEATSNFINEYGFEEQSLSDIITALTYFAFTTLSTVGLGDFHPKTSEERIVCSLVMLFGVMMTTFLTDSLSQTLKDLTSFLKSSDGVQDFNLFMGTLRRFNGNRPLGSDLEHTLEQFFQYRQVNNRSLTKSTLSDYKFLRRLPHKTKATLYVDYLYRNFFLTFKSLIEIRSYSRMGLRRKHLISGN